MNANPPAWLLEGRPGRARGLLIGAATSIVLLVYEASQPGGVAGLTPPIPHFDKIMHFGAHLWIALLAYWGLLLMRRPTDVRRSAWLIAGIVLTVDTIAGIGVELAQASLGAAHGRVFDWKDVIANVAGACTAVAASLGVTLHLAGKPS